MEFQIGDRIIHTSYGPGTITAIEEKKLADEPEKYYVIQTGELTLWVPLDATENRIRFPLSRSEFQEHLELIAAPGDALPDFHRERNGFLAERMKGGSLAEICLVIRDLDSRSKHYPPNNNDREVMSAATALLLNEWEIVAGITRTEAREELARFLGTR